MKTKFTKTHYFILILANVLSIILNMNAMDSFLKGIAMIIIGLIISSGIVYLFALYDQRKKNKRYNESN